MIEHYDAARRGAVFLDRSSRGRLWLSGPDRASYLQGLLTNDIKSLGPGEGCYSAYLTPQGRLICDMRLFETGDGLLMTLPASLVTGVQSRLERLIFAEQVTIEDRTQVFVQLGLHGPDAPRTLAQVLPATPGASDVAAFPGWRPFRNEVRAFQSGDVLVGATDELGGGYDLMVSAPLADALRAALRAAGARGGSARLAEVLRVEAGCPEFGVDMDEGTIPLEAGIEDRAISFTKGCYVGQEVIVRVRDRGQGRVARRLVGLTIDREADTQAVPPVGSGIHAGGREAGRVTSAVFSPALDRAIALGYVHRDFVEPRTRVEIVTGDGTQGAEVTTLPFVS